MAAPSIDLVLDAEPAYIVLAKTEHKGVMAAAKDLQRDITKITGVTPNIVHSLSETWGKCIVLGSADCPEGQELLASVGMPVDDLTGKWEVYKWRVLNNVGGKEQVLAIAGSNSRGTIFGIYEFEQQHLGIDPLWFWSDNEPPTRADLRFDDSINFGPTAEPTWKYRGWTLNDHPIFMEWKESGLVQRTRYSRYMFAIHPEVMDRLWEAALRLKMNLFSWYFVDIDWQPDHERLQSAVDRGLFITQHQMEGIGADTGFWDHYWAQHNPAGKPDKFSYRLHPESFHEFWSYYIKRWVEFSPQVVWEINLRGWADGPFTEVSLPDGGTPQERAELISQALADQAKLVREFDPNPDLEMMTTLYAEVGKFYDEGWIRIPPGVTTGFSDVGMSGMSYSKKFWTEKRDPERKYGQYFHTQYFGGGPQIARCTPIESYLKVNMDAMYQRGDTEHMLLAMNHLRHQQMEIRGIAEMLWDYPSFDPREYQLRYCREQFGDDLAPQISALYDAYYEKYPHYVKDDGFKTYPYYYKVMEPMFTIIANLHNIDVGTRDGFALNNQYKRDIYEQGIRDLGEVLEQSQTLRSSVPKERLFFFDYEFTDSIRLVRGLYKLSIATQDAIEHLKEGDRSSALAVLLEAKPLTEELYAAFRNQRSSPKWENWYRGGTNQDFYALYNLYQKARLRLEVDSMSIVSEIEPQRHPYFGNVVTDDPAQVGDAVYGSQVERLNSSFYNGARQSLTEFPLQGVFQIGGIRSVESKWKTENGAQVTDHGLGYRFQLDGRATIFVAKPKADKLEWLEQEGFKLSEQALSVGEWAWPYRYRNRPPTITTEFDIFSKEFPAGEVKLGPNSTKAGKLPYIVFVKPSLLAYENFRQGADAWKTHGSASVVRVTEWDAEMRPSVFDLSTVPRYRPVDLHALKLDAGASAEFKWIESPRDDFVLHVRLKCDQASTISIGSIAIPVAGAAGWQNVKVRVSPSKGKYQVETQDDSLKLTVGEELSFQPGEIDQLKLSHKGKELLCNAVCAYLR